MITPKNDIINNINNEIVDNTEGKISPYDVRHNLIDIVDSVHLLLEDRSIDTLNFSTPNTRSVRAGEQALSKINLDGYFTQDNVAVGYSALKANYQGGKNTAIGSQSLNCNIYGSGNSAVGSNALGGNTTGNGNVGIGNNTLLNNKVGNFNIAIGHSAGYYVTRNTSNKLFIASHPVDSEYICDNPLGSGLIPLVYGDLSNNNLRFGIAVRNLHSAATLQVSGGISPSVSSIDNLGNSDYRFKDLYLSNSISFPSGKSIDYTDEGKFTINNSILPLDHREYQLGASGNQWKEGHFYDIYVSGTAYIENYIRKTIFDCEYECKTLYLASSGVCDSETGCGYLNDQQLSGAGFVVKSSGANYLRDYSFTFRPSGNTVSSLEEYNIYSKSHWLSNISLHVASGNHISVNRIIGNNKLSLTTDPDSYGIFINNKNIYVGSESIIPPLANNASGTIAGLGDINFVKPSGQCADYSFVIGALESGVNVSQKFITGIKQRNKDALNNNKDKLEGFELKYYDNSEVADDFGATDKFIIRSFNNSSEGINHLSLMKEDINGGVFGINNFGAGGDSINPKTIFNIRSKDNAVARITAENLSSGVHSALQLLGGSNCLTDGFEAIYYHDSGIADLNLYQDSGKLTAFRFRQYQAGLFSSGITNGTLTIGYSGFPQASISLRDNTFINGASVTPTAGYGKIYNAKVAREYANQSHTLFFIDASGYTHDLTANRHDIVDARAVYSEDFLLGDSFGGNTFAGHRAPATRLSFTSNRSGNTAFGTRALFSLGSGDFNTALGLHAGSGITNGYDNTIIGSLAGRNINNGYRNIVIGNNSFNSTSGTVNYNIVFGTNIGNNHNKNYDLLIGHDNLILVSGSLGPSTQNRLFCLPSSGTLQINNTNNTNKLLVRNDSIQVYNDIGRYPQTNLQFNFATASGSNTLLTLNHSVAKSGNATYSCDGLPYAELNGNLKLLNNICFSDSTTLNSSNFLNVIDHLESSGIALNNKVNSLFIEGMAVNTINNPSSFLNPTSGVIQTMIPSGSQLINGPLVFVTNRDKYLRIDGGDYVVALSINGEYRPVWASSEALLCEACRP